MRTEHRDLPVDCVAPIAVCLVAFGLMAGLGFLGGYWLMQPRVFANVGLAAYEPPPGTRLIPLPRKMDAPELADLPPAPVESVGAQADRPPESVEKTTVAVTPNPVPRRPKARPANDPWSAYAYSGRWGQSERWGRDDRWIYGQRSDRSWSFWRGGNGRW